MKKDQVIHLPIKGDGNCLFHAIVKYLELDEKYGHSNQRINNHQLRLDSIQWLRNNLQMNTSSGLTIEEQIEMFVNDTENMNSVEDYLKYMRKDKKYGGQIEIFAISHLLNRNIKTYIDRGDLVKYNNVGLGNNIKKDNSDMINLYHNISEVGNDEAQYHFEILYPVDKVPALELSKLMKKAIIKKPKKKRKKDTSKKKKLGVKLTNNKKKEVQRSKRKRSSRIRRRNSRRRSMRRSTRRSVRRSTRRKRSSRIRKRKRSSRRRSMRRSARRTSRRRSTRRKRSSRRKYK